MKKILLVFILLTIVKSTSPMSTRPSYANREVKVLLQQGVSQVALHGSIVSIHDVQGQFISDLQSPLTISKGAQGLAINGQDTLQELLAVTSARGIVTVQNKPYRGKILISENSAGGLIVINELPLEDYLRGVVASEMSEDAPLEALKAQAVAARTYALFHMSENHSQSFDINLPEKSQAYRGVDGEHLRSDQAVQETEGVILEYHGKIFQSFFHSRCGGYTLGTNEVWPTVKDAPQGKQCRPCMESGEKGWKYWIKNSELCHKLAACGYRIPKEFPVILNRNIETQRIESFQLANQYIPAVQLRNILGPDHLKSTIFSVKLGRFSMRFYGKGWGHGVGLCQYGAIGLAKQGVSYERILSYYYPKSDIVKYS